MADAAHLLNATSKDGDRAPKVPDVSPTILSSIRRVIRSTLQAGLGLTLVLELILIVANVVGRDLFSLSFLWVLGAQTVAIVVLIFLGAPVAYETHQHMAVHIVTDRLNDTAQGVVRAVQHVVVAICSFALLLITIRQLMLQQGPTYWQIADVPGAVYLSVMVVGFALIVASAVTQFGADIKQRRGQRLVLAATGGLLAIVLGAAFLYLPLGGQYELVSEGAAPWVIALSALCLALLGIPIGFAMLGPAMFVVLTTSVAPPSIIVNQVLDGVDNVTLLAVPFFVFAGSIMGLSGISRRMLNFAHALVGNIRGGVLATVVVAMFVFSGISGSKLADVAAVGVPAREIVDESGYQREELAGVLTASAVMGETVPPSLAILIVGSITTLSIGSMFLAGVLPAILLGCILVAAILLRRRDMAAGIPAWTIRARGAALLQGLPVMVLPVALVGGIIRGLASPSETAALASVYGLIIYCILERRLDWASLWHLAQDAALLASRVLFLLAGATLLTWTLAIYNVPQTLANALKPIGPHRALLILSIIVMCIIAGSFLEGVPVLVVLVPLLLPIGASYGINAIQLAIVMIIAQGAGLFLPPLGVGAYATATTAGTSVERSARFTLPYIGVVLLGLLLVAFIPALTL